MNVFLNAIMPLMTLIAIGFTIGKIFPGDKIVLSKLTLWVFATVLTFSFVNDHPPGAKEILSYGGAFLLIFLYNLAVFKVLLKKHEKSDVYFLTSIFGNTGYLGYPVLGLAFGQEAIAYGVIYSVISVSIVNTLGVAFMVKNLKQSVKNLLKLPFLYAVALGLSLGYLGINWHNFPTPLSQSMEMINNAAIPIITVFLGVSMSSVNLKKKALTTVLSSSLHRLLIIPVIAIFASQIFGMRGLFRAVFIVESAMPTAMNAAVISAAIDKDPEIVSTEIAVSTMLSALTLSLIINLIK